MRPMGPNVLSNSKQGLTLERQLVKFISLLTSHSTMYSYSSPELQMASDEKQINKKEST